MRPLVRKHLDELCARKKVPESNVTLLGFWGANRNVGAGQLSQWYMSHSDMIKVSPETVPALGYYWKDFMSDSYLVPSAEHAMMLSKAIVFDGSELMLSRIVGAPNPASAKALGRSIPNFGASLWERLRYPIVRDINIYKFKETGCRKSLEHFNEVYAGHHVLFVETSPYDAIWGIKNGQVMPIEKWQGDNLLGFAITEAFDTITNGG